MKHVWLTNNSLLLLRLAQIPAFKGTSLGILDTFGIYSFDKPGPFKNIFQLVLRALNIWIDHFEFLTQVDALCAKEYSSWTTVKSSNRHIHQTTVGLNSSPREVSKSGNQRGPASDVYHSDRGGNSREWLWETLYSNEPKAVKALRLRFFLE